MKTYDVHDATEESLILAARLRVGRNDAGVCFPHAADPDELAGVKDRVLSALHAACSPGEWEMRVPEELNAQVRSYLTERGLMSRTFAKSIAEDPASEHRSFGVFRGGIASIEINGADHVRILGYRTEESLKDIWSVLDPLDDVVETGIPYAFSEERGYLTANPGELGTALRADLTLFLPILMVSGRIEAAAKAISRKGLTLSPLMGGAGGMFLITNAGGSGADEEQVLDLVDTVSKEVADKERALRSVLFRDQPVRVRDYIGRALGVLKNCWVIDTVESWSLIAAVQLGCELGIVDEELSAANAFALMCSVQSGHMMVERMGHEDGSLEDPEIGITRAQVLRERFSDVSIRD